MPNCILIVDDSPHVKRGLRNIIESVQGWIVCGEAINGRDGIEQAQRLNPDLIILDISMPEMDGITAAKILEAQMPMLPIIMFTNLAEDQLLKREVFSPGIRQVVCKSDSQSLVHAIQNVLLASNS